MNFASLKDTCNDAIDCNQTPSSWCREDALGLTKQPSCFFEDCFLNEESSEEEKEVPVSEIVACHPAKSISPHSFISSTPVQRQIVAVQPEVQQVVVQTSQKTVDFSETVKQLPQLQFQFVQHHFPSHSPVVFTKEKCHRNRFKFQLRPKRPGQCNWKDFRELLTNQQVFNSTGHKYYCNVYDSISNMNVDVTQFTVNLLSSTSSEVLQGSLQINQQDLKSGKRFELLFKTCSVYFGNDTTFTVVLMTKEGAEVYRSNSFKILARKTSSHEIQKEGPGNAKKRKREGDEKAKKQKRKAKK